MARADDGGAGTTGVAEGDGGDGPDDGGVRETDGGAVSRDAHDEVSEGETEEERERKRARRTTGAEPGVETAGAGVPDPDGGAPGVEITEHVDLGSGYGAIVEGEAVATVASAATEAAPLSRESGASEMRADAAAGGRAAEASPQAGGAAEHGEGERTKECRPCLCVARGKPSFAIPEVESCNFS